jgi:hypothetical protein
LIGVVCTAEATRASVSQVCTDWRRTRLMNRALVVDSRAVAPVLLLDWLVKPAPDHGVCQVTAGALSPDCQMRCGPHLGQSPPRWAGSVP